MKSLYNQYPFRSPKKFIPLAQKHGFTRSEALKFLASLPHDIKFTRQRDLMLPIYSKHPGGYQFDTLVQTSNANPKYFLIIININSRQLFAYPMNSKNSNSVHKVMAKFITDHPDIYSFTSDQDRAYQSLTQLFLDHHIDYQTTFSNDHNRLGIINRAIKTLRDMNRKRDFTTASMKKFINAYNNSVHSSIGIEPINFTINDEINYIDRMSHKDLQQDLKPNSHVRVINESKVIGKKRSNLSDGSYVVDSKIGNKYIIRAKDKSVAEYPRYRLVPDTKAKLAKSLGKRAIIDHIISYKNKHYRVKFTDGTIDTLTIGNLREGHPTKLSIEETKFWNKNKLPEEFKAYLN